MQIIQNYAIKKKKKNMKLWDAWLPYMVHVCNDVNSFVAYGVVWAMIYLTWNSINYTLYIYVYICPTVLASFSTIGPPSTLCLISLYNLPRKSKLSCNHIYITCITASMAEHPQKALHAWKAQSTCKRAVNVFFLINFHFCSISFFFAFGMLMQMLKRLEYFFASLSYHTMRSL